MTSDEIEFAVEARKLDAEGAILPAAWAYEVAISQGVASLDLMLDLHGIYECAGDPGFVHAHRLPKLFARVSWDRADEVLAAAEARFGRRDEIEFWRGYRRESLGLRDSDFVSACRKWLAGGETLVPAMYLYAFVGDRSVEAEAKRLHESVRGGRTTRERSIRGVLEGGGSRSA